MPKSIDTTTLSRVLALQEEQVGDFVRDAIVDKRLSTIMADLNLTLMNGDPDTRAQAHLAITRLGFIA